MFPLRIRTVGMMEAIAGIAGMTARHHIRTSGEVYGEANCRLWHFAC
jgi:hypothetical protein